MIGRRTAPLNIIHHHYFKTMMITGLIKSTIGTFLMTIGGSILVYTFVQPGNYAWHAPLTATALIAGGVFVYFIGDVYKVIQKRREEEQLQRQYVEHLNKELSEICGDINDIKKHMGLECNHSYCDTITHPEDEEK